MVKSLENLCTAVGTTGAGARAVANVSESAVATGVVCSASEDLSIAGSLQICVAFRPSR